MRGWDLRRRKSDAYPRWGRMSATQMLAHGNAAYEVVYGQGVG